MKYGSVCSGIEAASVAWHELGWEAVFVSEIEPFPCAVLAHHYPAVPNYGDMTKFKEWPDAKIDVLVGGTPCQSFSQAGLRKGLADPRGNLMLTYLAIADRYRPEWLVWENVPGVLSSNGGKDFGTFLSGLAELGYGFAYRILDAQNFGVPQRRRRVFVVGHLGDWRRAAAVLFERESLRRDTAPSRKAGTGITHPVAPSIGASGRGFSRAGETRGQDPVVAVGTDCYNGAVTGDVAATLGTPGSSVNASGPTVMGTWWDGGQTSQTLDAVLSKGQCMPEKNRFPAVLVPETAGAIAQRIDRGGVNSEGDDGHLVPVAIRTAQTSSNGWGINQEGTAYTIDQAQGQAVATPVAWSIMPQNSGKDYKAREVEVLQPIMASGQTHGNQGGDVIQSAMQVRRLTVEECEKLQGFSPGWTDVPFRGKPAADGPRYKSIGNSMAVPCMSFIGKRIMKIKEICDE